MTSDPIGDQIRNIDEQIKKLKKQRDRLQRKHGKPCVIPVVIYYKYGTKYVEPADVSDSDNRSPLEQAYGQLWGGLEDGHLSPQGVEIGRVFYEYWQLDEKFGYG